MVSKLYKEVWGHFKRDRYKLTNVFVFGWESDFICVTDAGYVTEVEIKVSKSDFKADFSKQLASGIFKHDYLKDESKTFKPHKFYFALPEGLVEHSEIPIEYGIIELTIFGARIKRKAKFLHRENLFNSNKFLKQLLSKFYYRNIDLRNALELRDWDIKYKQERLKFNT